MPDDKGGLAVGIVLGAAGLGNVIGPLIAGLGAALTSWRLIFWVNLPLVIIIGLMLMALSSLKCDNPTQFSSACFSKIFSR